MIECGPRNLRVLPLPLPRHCPLAAGTGHRVNYFLTELAARGIHVDVAPFLDAD